MDTLSLVHPPGSLAGVVSTVGYKFVTSKLYSKLGIHDTCGVRHPTLITITTTIITTSIAITKSLPGEQPAWDARGHGGRPQRHSRPHGLVMTIF